jgi:hypothetical protein
MKILLKHFLTIGVFVLAISVIGETAHTLLVPIIASDKGANEVSRFVTTDVTKVGNGLSSARWPRPTESQTPAEHDANKVGNGFSFTQYWVADWTGDGKPDLLVRDAAGTLQLYPFKNGSFYSGGGPKQVANGFTFTHYFVADWTGDGTPDMLVRNNKGDLLLYPFKDGSFYHGGGPKQVGNGWVFTDYFVADWTGDGTPDLIVRKGNGDLLLYPFRNGSFY